MASDLIRLAYDLLRALRSPNLRAVHVDAGNGNWHRVTDRYRPGERRMKRVWLCREVD